MKRFFILLCLLCMTACTAYGDSVYEILPCGFDEAVMTSIALGDRADQAVRDEQTESAMYYHLPGINGAPAYGSNLHSPVQLSFSVYTDEGATSRYNGTTSENVVETGIAPCTLTREEALSQAEALMEQIGLSDRALLSVTAFGRFSETTPFYQLRFLQTLNERPVYWSAYSVLEWMTDIHLSSNTVQVIVGDNGLASINGIWSRFVPTGEAQDVLPESDALQALIAAGEAPDHLERCYLMVFDGISATATPAYRWQNRFVNAFTGELMQ